MKRAGLKGPAFYVSMEQYYRILGLPNTASAADIKQSYRRLAMMYHPDRNSSEEAKDKFLLIQAAYDILSNAAPVDPKLAFGDEPQSSEVNASTHKYKKSTFKKKHKEDYDPDNHIPNYAYSYVTTEDADYTCLSRIFLLGILGTIATALLLYIGHLYIQLNFACAFFTLSFLLFDAFLIWDLHLEPVLYHAFMVKVTNDIKKNMFSFLMSMDARPFRSASASAVRQSERYRNYFYARSLKFDYKAFTYFTVERSRIFSLCLKWSGHNKYQSLELPYLTERRTTIMRYLYLLIPIGCSLLVVQNYDWCYPLSLLYFIYHIYFIRQCITSNKLD